MLFAIAMLLRSSASTMAFWRRWSDILGRASFKQQRSKTDQSRWIDGTSLLDSTNARLFWHVTKPLDTPRPYSLDMGCEITSWIDCSPI